MQHLHTEHRVGAQYVFIEKKLKKKIRKANIKSMLLHIRNSDGGKVIWEQN